MRDPSLDRRDFLRVASLAALGVAAGCSNGTPGGTRTPTPTGSESGTPSPTPSGSQRAIGWRRIGATGPKARSHHTLTANEDGAIVFLFGGRTKGRIFKDAWAFDRAARLWQPLPNGPEPRFGHSAAFVAGHLVIFGGQAGGGKFFNDAWAFDSIHGTWLKLSTGAKKPAARSGASGTTIGSSLTISHGLTAGGRADDTWALSNKWTNVTPASGPRPSKRAEHRVAYITGLTKMLLFGGRSDRSLLGDTWLYDPTVLTWSQLAIAGPSPRSGFAAAATAKAAYIFGGASARGLLKDVWQFDGKTWRAQRPSGTLPPARTGVEGAIITGPNMLVFGGTDGTRDFDDLWELTLPA